MVLALACVVEAEVDGRLLLLVVLLEGGGPHTLVVGGRQEAVLLLVMLLLLEASSRRCSKQGRALAGRLGAPLAGLLSACGASGGRA